MDPVQVLGSWSPWSALSTGISAGSSLLGGLWHNQQQKAAAQKQMDFQERMSSTAYQRATADMRNSGINPALAYMQGGASSPGGAMPQLQDAIGPAVSSAQHGARLGAEMKMMKQDFVKRGEEIGLVRSERDAVDQNTAKTKVETALLMAQIPGAKNTESMNRTWWGKALPYVTSIGKALPDFGVMFAPGQFGRMGTRAIGGALRNRRERKSPGFRPGVKDSQW